MKTGPGGKGEWLALLFRSLSDHAKVVFLTGGASGDQPPGARARARPHVRSGPRINQPGPPEPRPPGPEPKLLARTFYLAYSRQPGL